MFGFADVFQSVLVTLQESFAGVIVQFLTSLFGSILPGVLPGA